MGGGYFTLLYFSIALSLAIVFFCKAFLGKSVLLSFIGRNSLWIMCTHHLLYRPIKLVMSRLLDGNLEPIATLLLTLVVCCVTAPFVNKYCPVVVGKKR